LTWKPFQKVGHYRVADIEYPGGTKGRLVYVSHQLTGNEPADVLAYARLAHERGEHFPHQATSDLWFDEAQFESYMRLGQHSAEGLLQDIRKVIVDGGIDPSPIAIADLTGNAEDLRPEVPVGVAADPVLAASQPKPLPLPFDTVTDGSWWTPLVKPVAASVVASASVIGLYNLVSDTSIGDRSSTVTVSRSATVVDRRERTFLLPWFDELRPTVREYEDVMAAIGNGLPPLEGRLEALNNEARRDRQKLGAPLRPADIERVRRLAGLIGQSCQGPLVVRGLASSSRIDVSDDTACRGGDRATVSACRNVNLANRRAEMMGAILRMAGVAEVEVEKWDVANPRPMRDAQFDDLDPNSDEAASTSNRETPGYSVNRGAFNRSVELIPQAASCDFDLIQQRLAVMVVDRGY
jgi:hypothetical protein